MVNHIDYFGTYLFGDRLKFKPFFFGTYMQIFTEKKHAFYFGATSFGDVQEVYKFCRRTRVKAFCDIVHYADAGSLYLVFESPIAISIHHRVNGIYQFTGFLPNKKAVKSFCYN
jgi:hypothetical protein